MMMLEMKTTEFLEELSSKAPVPGEGEPPPLWEPSGLPWHDGGEPDCGEKEIRGSGGGDPGGPGGAGEAAGQAGRPDRPGRPGL